MNTDKEIRSQPMDQSEELTRSLSILLNNTVQLLENIMEYVPNQIEWANMLDGIHREVEESEKELKDYRGFPSKE